MKKTGNIINSSVGRVAIACCLLFTACSSVHAQIKFSASAPRSVAVNQNFQLTFSVENGSAKTLTPPSLTDFQVLGGPSTSQNMMIVNGTVSQSVSYTYVLRPKKEGSYTIGKATANIEGVNVESNELDITVTGPAQQQAQQRRDPFNDPFGDPFGQDPFEQQEQQEQQQQQQQQPQQSTADVQKQLKDNVYVKIVTDKSSVYIGEPVTATIRIYFKNVNIGNLGMNKAPAFDGFWSQEVQMPKEVKPHAETINGQQYNVADIQQYNLYPQRAGNLQISPVELNMVVQAAVRKARRGFFDMFGPQYQNFQFKATSNSVTIAVKDVPAAGKPADFSGAVGKFSYTVKLSATEGKTDNAVTYSVKIAGTGNLKTVDLPKPQMPDGFEVFDPKVKEDVTNTAAGMNGSKQYDYLVIPRQPGDYKIPGASFSYFDPSAGKYISISSPELSLKVTGAPSQNPNTNQPSASNKEDVSLLHADIRFIKTRSGDLDKSNTPFFASAGYIGLLVSPFLLFVGLIFVKRRNEGLAADLVGAKRRRATRLAKKRLSVAEKHLSQNNKQAFYDEVSRAMWGYLGDKLNIDQSQLSKDNVEDKLLAKQVKIDTVVKLKSLINTCELALYSPVGAGDEMKQNYHAAISLITDLEDEIK
jgi:hypothetical protein